MYVALTWNGNSYRGDGIVHAEPRTQERGDHNGSPWNSCFYITGHCAFKKAFEEGNLLFQCTPIDF